MCLHIYICIYTHLPVTAKRGAPAALCLLLGVSRHQIKRKILIFLVKMFVLNK